MKPVALRTICRFLDDELQTLAFNDNSNNGLQVANPGKITRVCCGVDASLDFFRAAQARGADLLVVHHGLSWDSSLKRITGLNYDRLAFLLKHDMALYASHLPLDAHPVHGNNAQLCKALGVERLTPYGNYRGQNIGFRGVLARPLKREAFVQRVRDRVRSTATAMLFGPERVRTVAVISGGAPESLLQAEDADMFVSGEATLSTYNSIRDQGMNAVFAGHYTTECYGPRALARLLQRKFGLPCEFLDLQVPY